VSAPRWHLVRSLGWQVCTFCQESIKPTHPHWTSPLTNQRECKPCRQEGERAEKAREKAKAKT